MFTVFTPSRRWSHRPDHIKLQLLFTDTQKTQIFTRFDLIKLKNGMLVIPALPILRRSLYQCFTVSAVHL